MKRTDLNHFSEDYRRIEQAIRTIETNAARQPELGETAADLNLSEYPFQRSFTQATAVIERLGRRKLPAFSSPNRIEDLVDHLILIKEGKSPSPEE